MNNIKTGLSYIENFGCKIENNLRVSSFMCVLIKGFSSIKTQR